MTRNEYLERMRNQPEWKPGWEAISDRFESVYGKGAFQYINAATMPEGSERLGGFGAAISPDGFVHIVTCGLTNIKASGDAYGNVVSGWGYEITVKWPGNDLDACRDAFMLLNRLAAYAQVKRMRFRSYQAFSLRLLSPVPAVSTDAFAGVLFLEDTRLSPIDTVNGRVAFLQIVNITATELIKLRRLRHLTRQLAFNLSKEYPDLSIDASRKTDYLV